MSDEPTIAPALTPSEWAAGHADRDGYAFPVSIERDTTDPTKLYFYFMGAIPPREDDDAPMDAGDVLPPPTRHALAALCLHGQPFGFTHADLDVLRETVRLLEMEIVASGPHEAVYERAGRPRITALESLAARIAALLPPSSPSPTP